MPKNRGMGGTISYTSKIDQDEVDNYLGLCNPMY